MMAVEANALGEYLRARRQQVRPDDVGMVPGARRRVAGLRREELAMLAGIGAEYYLRLEVGRDTNPSVQVIEALARALRLDAKATQHLHNLAHPTGSDTSDLEVVRAYALAELVDQFLTPAIVATDTWMCWRQMRLPAPCHQSSRRDKTSCVGAS